MLKQHEASRKFKSKFIYWANRVNDKCDLYLPEMEKIFINESEHDT